MANSLRNTKQWRTGAGDLPTKLSQEFGKVAYNPSSPGLKIVGGVGVALGTTTTPIATGLTTVLACSHSVVSPVTPNAYVSVTPKTDGNLQGTSTPAVLISWMAIGW